MNETENPKKVLNLLAVLMAFILGITVGSIDYGEVKRLIKDDSVTETLSSEKNREEYGGKVTAAEYITEDCYETTHITVTDASEETTDEDYYVMYRTPTGKRYHFNPDCAGVNRIKTTYDEATGLGLTPCKKCADG